jgi:small subunit ribosomal protein S27e
LRVRQFMMVEPIPDSFLARPFSTRQYSRKFHPKTRADDCFPCYRFLPLTFSTQLLKPRPESTSSRYAASLFYCAVSESNRKPLLQTLVPGPRSFFMDVKCPGCFTITTVFSHAQTVVICAGCSTVLCQPTGGKARLTEGCSFRRK